MQNGANKHSGNSLKKKEIVIIYFGLVWFGFECCIQMHLFTFNRLWHQSKHVLLLRFIKLFISVMPTWYYCKWNIFDVNERFFSLSHTRSHYRCWELTAPKTMETHSTQMCYVSKLYRSEIYSNTLTFKFWFWFWVLHAFKSSQSSYLIDQTRYHLCYFSKWQLTEKKQLFG